MTKHADSGMTGVALFVGIAVILGWLVTVAWLALNVGAEEVRWSRLVFLLGSVEAVAFGAAGALFGTNVQRQRVAEAHSRAERAETEAAENKEAAVKGKALAAVVKSEAKSNTSGKGLTRGLDTTTGEVSASVILANDLFP